MNKTLAILALACLGVSACANTISGKFYWISGTLVNPVTPKPTPQTVTLKVGTVNKSASIYVPGDSSSPLPAGTTFEILEASSQPFAATFSGTSVSVSTGYGGPTTRANAAMSSAGVLTYGIGFAISPYTSISLVMYYPPFSIGSLAFKNGMTLSVGTPITAYSFTLPTGSTTTLGSMTIPTGADPVQSFDFEANGNGTLSVNGSGTVPTLWCSGNLIGLGTIFTGTTLTIQPNGQ